MGVDFIVAEGSQQAGFMVSLATNPEDITDRPTSLAEILAVAASRHSELTMIHVTEPEGEKVISLRIEEHALTPT